MSSKMQYNINADIIRILAGFGVILIHVTDPYIVYPVFFGVRGASWEIIQIINALFKMSVPLFVMLSGYLMIKHACTIPTIEYYNKRLNRIVIPLLFWLCVHFGWNYYIGIPTNVYKIANDIVKVNLEHLYFMIVILELYLLTPLLSLYLVKAGKRARSGFVLLTVFFTLAYPAINILFPDARIVTNNHILFIYLPYVSYFILGYYIGEMNKINLRSISFLTLYFLSGLLIALLSNGNLNSYIRDTNGLLVYFMTIIVFVGVKQSNLFKKLSSIKYVESSVRYLSSTIFGVYLIHMIVIKISDKFFLLGVENTEQLNWIFVIGKIGGVFVVSFILVAIGKRISYIKYVFGWK